MADLTNKSLCFAQIAEGNKEAFDVFFRHYYPRLLRFARNFLGCSIQAEDVVAEVLTNLLLHRDRIFALDHFEAYLYSSVKNKALSSLKKNQRTDPYTSDYEDFRPLVSTASDPYEQLVEQELKARVYKIIEDFPPKRKMVYQLIREEGLSYRQVADIMEISERTVEVHLKLAVKALREDVERYLDRKKEKRAVKDLVKVLAPMLFFF